MKTSAWKTLLAKFEIRRGSVSPVQQSELKRYEKKTGFRLPQSYQGYCQVFGPGYLTMPSYYCICVPNAEAEEFNLDVLNTNNKPMVERPDSPVIRYVSDMEQLRRAVFFATDIGTSRFFWDPNDVGNEKDHEYGIYVLYRNYKVERLATTFWSFINDVCLGTGLPAEDNTGGIDLVFSPGK